MEYKRRYIRAAGAGLLALNPIYTHDPAPVGVLSENA